LNNYHRWWSAYIDWMCVVWFNNRFDKFDLRQKTIANQIRGDFFKSVTYKKICEINLWVIWPRTRRCLVARRSNLPQRTNCKWLDLWEMVWVGSRFTRFMIYKMVWVLCEYYPWRIFNPDIWYRERKMSTSVHVNLFRDDGHGNFSERKRKALFGCVLKLHFYPITPASRLDTTFKIEFHHIIQTTI